MKRSNQKNIKKILKDPLVIIIFFPFFFFMLCMLCLFVLFIVGQFVPPEMRLESHDSNKWTVQNPTEKIKLYCSSLEKISINNIILSNEDKDKLCGDSGYELSISDGENKFNIIGTSSNGKTTTLEIVIYFDEKSYNDRLASEESRRLAQQEEESRRAEEETKERLEAEAREFEEWQQKYMNIKNETIFPSIAKSDEMIELFSVVTDSYQTRNLADSYKNYFFEFCAEDIESKLAPNPSKVNVNVENLNNFYNDFCMYNEFLASRVIDYLEADTVSEQYDHLDMIGYYMGLINTLKVNINDTLFLLDQETN